MKRKTFLPLLLTAACATTTGQAQEPAKYDPGIQPENIQYFIPTDGASAAKGTVSIDGRGNICGAYANGVPANCIVTADVMPEGNCEEYGMFLRSRDNGTDSYKLSLRPGDRTVRLHDASISAVSDLDKPTSLTVVMKDDIIDVCIGGRRCIANRLPGKKGGQLWFFARNGRVRFRNITVRPML